MQGRKLYVGAKLRNLRQGQGLTQRDFAERLGISASYLNQMENNQRPLSASVIVALADGFNVDVTEFAADSGDRVVADLREALADPLFETHRPSLQELKIAASNTPDLAHAFLALSHAHHAALERLASLDDAVRSNATTLEAEPYEEVRDFFHYRDNYVDWLDRGAEALAADIGLLEGNAFDACAERLQSRHRIRVVVDAMEGAQLTLREFRSKERVLHVNADLPKPSRAFQLLQQIALLEEIDAIEQLLDEGKLRTDQSRAIARLGLANYFAGAAFLPYGAFASAARELRHDLELLSHRFDASLEQVAHRLSTLQRPGAKGVPFFFLRVDRAGTITKRHSATRLQFARYGGACPLWGVHRAFESPGEFVRQRAVTPDGERYFCVATTITKRAPGFNASIRRYAISIGCQVEYARDIVYADGLLLDDLESYEKIGVSCRICERSACPQRAVPPIGRQIHIDPMRRDIVPYEIKDPDRA